jgi:hypothetical protein
MVEILVTALFLAAFRLVPCVLGESATLVGAQIAARNEKQDGSAAARLGCSRADTY